MKSYIVRLVKLHGLISQACSNNSLPARHNRGRAWMSYGYIAITYMQVSIVMSAGRAIVSIITDIN